MTTLRHRGLMLDLARGMERKPYYLELLPWLREWGYNLLHLHLLDDQGCRMVFPSQPGLASPDAFSTEEMRHLVAEAARHRIQVMPELECLGHSALLAALPCFSDLRLSHQDGVHFNALDPDHPATRPLLRDLISDAVSVFPCTFLHVGLDEVDFSGLPRFATLPKSEHWRSFAAHAAWVHDEVRRHGRRPAMWGDHLLSAREMAGMFAKDLLVLDWHYHAEVDPASLDFLETSGFEVWAAPATMWWYARLLTNPGNFCNLREFTAHACQRQRRRVTGAVNTVWCPWRYLPGAMDWPMAWAGQVFSGAQEDPNACRAFCQAFYGLGRSDATDAAAAILTLHELAPTTPQIDRVMRGGVYHTRERVRQCLGMLPRLATAIRRLDGLVGSARRNGDRLQDVVLSGKLIERWALRGAKAGRAPTRPARAAAYRRRWREARPTNTEVPQAAGSWQHALRLADALARR